MKKLAFFLFLFFVALTFVGCNDVNSIDDLPKLDESTLAELNNSLSEKGYHLDFYLGEYNGYYVGFHYPEVHLTVISEKTIAGYTFFYHNSFILFAYNGEVFDLKDLYCNGTLSKKDIRQINKYYVFAYQNKLL